MSVSSDKLREMINDSTTEVANLTRALVNVDELIDEYTAQKSALDTGMMDITSAEILVILDTKGDYVYTWGDYGTKNVTEFRVYDLTFDGNVTYISTTSFRVTGDQTALFTAHPYIRADCGVDGFKYNTVKTVSYSAPNTTVVIEDTPEITANIVDVYTDVYNYGDDTDIDSEKVEFDFAYDWISKTLSDTGTYGIDVRIDSFTASKTSIGLNKTKYTDAITKLERFAT